MFDQYGTAVVGERRHDRRFAALENYLRMEYGSASGMDRYVAQANHGSSPHAGLRPLLAGIARKVSRSLTRAPAAATDGPALSEECAKQLASSNAP